MANTRVHMFWDRMFCHHIECKLASMIYLLDRSTSLHTSESKLSITLSVSLVIWRKAIMSVQEVRQTNGIAFLGKSGQSTIGMDPDIKIALLVQGFWVWVSEIVAVFLYSGL